MTGSIREHDGIEPWDQVEENLEMLGAMLVTGTLLAHLRSLVPARSAL